MTRRIRLGVLAIVGVGAVGGACSSAAPGPSTTRYSLGPGLSGVGALPAAASGWPEAGFDARHSSATTATGPQTAHVRWRRALGADATPGPVLGTDGTILAATNAGVLHDLDPRTGADVWIYDGHGSFGSDLSTSPAVIAGGGILWPGPHDTLFALSAHGRLLWSESFAGQVLSPAVAGHHRVYVADLAGHLTALEVTATGHRRVWAVSVGGTDYASPTVGRDGSIYTASDHDLVAVRDLGSRGQVLWRFHTRKMIEVSNAVAPNGDVVLGTNHDKEYGVRPDGNPAWSVDIGDYTYSSSTVGRDGLAYFGDNMGRVRVLDTTTGTVKQTIAPLKAGSEKVWTSIVADAKGDFYWATTQGHVYGYTAAGHQLFHLDVGAGVNSYPALGADGTLYLGTGAGTLVAIGPGSD